MITEEHLTRMPDAHPLLRLPQAHTSIHVGAVTVLLDVSVDQKLMDGLLEASTLIGALLLAERDKLNVHSFEMALPVIQWPAGVELPGGAQ